MALLFSAYPHELARYPLAAPAFIVEIRAAGRTSQVHRRAVYDQSAELSARIPGADHDQLTHTAVIALSEEIIAREITDHGTDPLPELEPTLTKLATRLLTPST